MSCPLDYFGFESISQRQDIFQVPNPSDVVIVGGGGLLHFTDEIERLAKLPCKRVAWGIGTNTHEATQAHYPESLKEFDLVGVRDYGQDFNWVPCVSAMHSYFDQKVEIEHETVIYEHKDWPMLPNHTWPRRQNNAKSLEEIVAFLGSAETVITNTYHGVYWTLLLGRKAVIYQPFSNRFLFFKWPVPIAYLPEDLPQAIKRAKSYSEALLESRKANRQFAAQVRNLILCS